MRKFAQQVSRERAGETWDGAQLFVFKLGSAYTPSFSPSDGLIILDVPETEHAPADNDVASAAYMRFAPLAAAALKRDVFGHVMVVDCHRIVKEWPREAASRSLGPVAKPMSRVIQKLNPSSCTVAAFGMRSALALLKLVVHKNLPEGTERLVFAVCVCVCVCV